MINRSRILPLLFIASFFGVLSGIPAGCTRVTEPDETSTAGGPSVLDVVVTTSMVADVVAAVGGEHVQVKTLLGPGVDPHLHQVSRDDVAAIMAADVVFYSGLMLEGKMTDAFRRLGEKVPVHAVTEDLSENELLTGEAGSGHPDPHVWMDVKLWGKTSDTVAEVLAERLPEHAERFRAAAAEYQSGLESLDDFARKAIGSIPDERRILISSHDAFGYLGRAYEIEVLGVQGMSTDSEAGLRRVNELVDLLVTRKVPAVFIESSVSSKSIEALIDGAASRGHTVKIGGQLYSDAAGESGTPEGTYPGMIRHNIKTITEALGGAAR